jgi:hypothetical protein
MFRPGDFDFYLVKRMGMHLLGEVFIVKGFLDSRDDDSVRGDYFVVWYLLDGNVLIIFC